MKKAKSVFLITLILIIAAGVAFYALYYLPNQQEKNADSTDNISGASTELNQDDDNNDADTKPTQILPTVSTTHTIITSATIFLDKNLNTKRDAGEDLCSSCFARALVCTSESQNLTPKMASIINVAISTKGDVPLENFKEGYTCWGSYDDRKVIIPHYTMQIGDGIQNVNVPAQEVEAVIAGVNSHITSIKKNSDGSYLYSFDLLIPILHTKFSQGKAIWIKFLPDSTKPDSYFIKATQIKLDSDGSVTDVPDSYYMVIDWGFSESYPGAFTIDGYTLMM